MRDNYSENLALVLAATSPSTNNTILECKCMLEPLAIRRDLKAEDYFDSAVLPRVRLFNESELIARRILREHPPDEPVAATEAGVHLLLVGNGSVGQSVLVNLARIGHYRSAKRPKVTIVDRRVQANWLETLRAFPALTDWLEVELEEIRIEDVEHQNVSRWLEDARPITMVFVCTKDEIANLRIARKLVESMKNRSIATGINPAKVVALDPPGGIVLSDFAKRGVRPDQFSLFSLVNRDNSCVAEGLLSDVDDSRAKLFHHDYCAKDDEKCAANPCRSKAINNKPWEALTEGMRDANRNVTDHFDVKLRAIGCKALPKGTAHPVTLTDQEHEILARMEHDRWWADKALAGWTHAPDRNDLQLLHPDMIPYEQLSDEIKQWDRNSVIKMIDILDSEGLVVTRTDDLVTG
jgi:predicted DNA binding CopG/RHH family protein